LDASFVRKIGGGIGYDPAVGYDEADSSSFVMTTGLPVSMSTGPEGGDTLKASFGLTASAIPILCLASKL
jgi:glyoxylate carboligase